MENTENRVYITKKNKKKRFAFSRVKRRLFKHVWLVRIGIFLVSFAGLLLLFTIAGRLTGSLGYVDYATHLKNFAFANEANVETFKGRTNIIILGKGGDGHDAPDLTDTIIFASISHDDGSVNMISLPRDIWVYELRTKLNSLYYWGNQKQEDGGLILAKSHVEEIVGQPLHYGIVIDFEGFKEIINVIGGIEVNVKIDFTDEKYPIAGEENNECNGDPDFGCRYETITFKRGLQMMDGEGALKFVRSRNAKGDEGTDLAREERQELVIAAVKDKILSPQVLLSPSKLQALYQISKSAIETDIDSKAWPVLARRFIEARERLKTNVLPEEFLLNPPKSYVYDNLYVFVAEADGWTQVHEWVEEILY